VPRLEPSAQACPHQRAQDGVPDQGLPPPCSWPITNSG